MGTSNPGSVIDRDDPSTVALFVPSMGSVGGVERVVVNLAKGLSNRGHSVDVVSCDLSGPFVDELPTGVSRSRLRCTNVPPAPVLGTIPALIRYLREQRPHTVISFMNQVNIAALLARRLSGIKTQLIISDHNNPRLLMNQINPDHLKDRLIYRAAKHMYPWADEIVAVSEGVAEDLSDIINVSEDRISVIYNPIVNSSIREQRSEPCDHEWLNDEDSRVILAAKPEPQKNLSMLISALGHIRDEDIKVIIVGTGSQSEEIRSLSKELDVQHRVDVRGYVENIYAYMSRSDVFAMTSYWEGLPTVLIEALACGCPVVSTDCPSGPREILRDGEFGRLVPVGDVEALTEALYDVITSPPDPGPLYRRAEDFSVESAIDKYDRLVGGSS